MKESETLNQINKFLSDKDNKKYHYNDAKSEDYKVSTGSLNLDLALGGGISSGVHRFTGINEGGKTSCALSIAREFQKQFKDGMVVLVMSEGRCSQEMMDRVGIDTNPEKFFRFDCNVFEKVFELVRMLVKDNPEDKKYFFLIDSIDALCRLNDVDKAFEDSEQVAGGALITSVFLKKMVLPIAKLNHIMILTSQVRVEVSANPYASRGGPKAKEAGGNAVKHYANFILEFQERYTNDILFTNPSATRLDDKGDPIGHYCKIKFKKSINERTGSQVRYPVKYGRKNGNSVWIEREILDLMKMWGYLEQKGSWIAIDQDLIEKMKAKKIDCPEKIQGEHNLVELVENSPKIKKFLFDHIKQELNSIS